MNDSNASTVTDTAKARADELKRHPAYWLGRMEACLESVLLNPRNAIYRRQAAAALVDSALYHNGKADRKIVAMAQVGK